MDKTIKLWYLLLCTTTVNNWFLERRQETGHQPLSLHLVLRFCCHFLISLNPESYVVRQLVKQLVNKVYCAKDKVQFYLWRSKFPRKLSKYAKYYGHICSIHKSVYFSVGTLCQNHTIYFLFTLLQVCWWRFYY